VCGRRRASLFGGTATSGPPQETETGPNQRKVLNRVVEQWGLKDRPSALRTKCSGARAEPALGGRDNAEQARRGSGPSLEGQGNRPECPSRRRRRVVSPGARNTKRSPRVATCSCSMVASEFQSVRPGAESSTPPMRSRACTVAYARAFAARVTFQVTRRLLN
jgi:hypothetical protein